MKTSALRLASLAVSLPFFVAACAHPAPVAPPVLPSTTAGVTPTASPRVRNVAIVVFPGVELLDFAGPGEVFGASDAFRVYTVAETKKPVTSEGFLTIEPSYAIDDAPKPDIVVIPGGNVHGGLLTSAPLMAWLHGAVANAEVATSVCNGAYALAKDGSLDGKRATTHWSAVPGLRKAAPKVTVVPDARYIDEGRVMTTAGVSAGIDGALHIVQRLLGDEDAWTIAHYLQYAWEPEDGAVAGRPPLTRAERDAMRARVMGAPAH